jgi:hypothetical protein
MKNSDTIGNRYHDLPVCSAVPQPTEPPRVPRYYEHRTKHKQEITCCGNTVVKHVYQNTSSALNMNRVIWGNSRCHFHYYTHWLCYRNGRTFGIVRPYTKKIFFFTAWCRSLQPGRCWIKAFHCKVGDKGTLFVNTEKYV